MKRNLCLFFAAAVFIVCLLQPPLFAQVVSFPDPALELTVREHLAKPSGVIQQADLLQLTRLTADARNIRNLEGLEHATNLQVLELSGNPTTNHNPIAQLQNLEELKLHAQGLRNIDFIAGLGLTRLDLWANQIPNLLPVNAVPTLRILFAPYNGIQTLPRLELPALEVLSLEGNPVALTPTLPNPLLMRELHIERTQVTDLRPVLAFANLEQLALGSTPVPPEQIPIITNLTRVRALFLFDQRLQNFEFLREMPQIVTLNLGANPAADWSPISSLFRLEWFALDNTGVTDLVFLAHLEKLRYVSAGDCRLVDISALQLAPRLEGFYLKNNRITDLTVLDLLPFLKECEVSLNSAFVLPGTINRAAIDRATARGAALNFLPQRVTTLRVGIDRARSVHVQGPVGGRLRLDSKETIAGAWFEQAQIGFFTGYTNFAPQSLTPATFYQAAKP